MGTSVTITGSYFGATQGSSTVTFNGTTATPTSWSNTSIVAQVPSGATTGTVKVTVNGIVSNGGYGPTFTVVTSPRNHELFANFGPCRYDGHDYRNEFWCRTWQQHGLLQRRGSLPNELEPDEHRYARA